MRPKKLLPIILEAQEMLYVNGKANDVGSSRPLETDERMGLCRI